MKPIATMKHLVFATLLALLATGCASFDHQWDSAAALPAQGVQGRWQGTWKSDATGHTEGLRCILKQTGEGKYDANFYAHYKWHIFRFSVGYHVRLEGQESEGTLKFHGDENLGWYAGGIYHYDGNATPTNFFSTYSCKYDHGTFQMSRP